MLQDEIKKKRPFEVPEEEAFLNLARTCGLLSGEFELLFKGHGLSEAKYNVLRILRGADAEGGLPCAEVSARLITRVPDVTRLTDGLERDELVTRSRTREDRRVVILQITEKGRGVLAKLDAPVTALHRQQLGHLTREELKELNRLLVKARHREG